MFIGGGEFWSLIKIKLMLLHQPTYCSEKVANFDPSRRYSWCYYPNQHIVHRGWQNLTPHEDKVDVFTPVNILFRGGGNLWWWWWWWWCDDDGDGDDDDDDVMMMMLWWWWWCWWWWWWCDDDDDNDDDDDDVMMMMMMMLLWLWWWWWWWWWWWCDDDDDDDDDHDNHDNHDDCKCGATSSLGRICLNRRLNQPEYGYWVIEVWILLMMGNTLWIPNGLKLENYDGIMIWWNISIIYPNLSNPNGWFNHEFVSKLRIRIPSITICVWRK